MDVTHGGAVDQQEVVVDRFDYLIERLRDATIEEDPFPHLHLRDFLSADDFDAITRSADVDVPAVRDTAELFEVLEAAGYAPTQFPGATTSRDDYLAWLDHAHVASGTHEACEAMGMVVRQQSRPTDPTVRALNDFFRSERVQTLLKDRFGVEGATTAGQVGLQKYLHGYEISPHPDIRRKALTWMLNVSPATVAADADFHTHYMRFRPEWSFVAELWRHNPDIDTCWVPWGWCETVKRQTDNNSIVVFAPRWDTIHAVRAHYDHLAGQRTQFFGNLWFDEPGRGEISHKPHFRDFDHRGRGSGGGAATSDAGSRRTQAARALRRVMPRR